MREDRSDNSISIGQIEADLFVVKELLSMINSLPSSKSKYYKGLAAYHLQQSVEKLIKYQIYRSESEIDNYRMYKHSLDELILYGESLDVELFVPEWISNKRFVITDWEAKGRYDMHFVVRKDTLERCYNEVDDWIKKYTK